MTVFSNQLWRRLAIAGCLAAALAGCEKRDRAQSGSSSGQVIARVGEQVVTTQELETEFRHANVPVEKRKDPEMVKQILSGLVARKYAMNQAIAAKLDREPGVLLDLLRSREQVLENAFLTRTVASKAFSKADVDKYIANNPSKFSQRKFFTVEQIAFPFGPAGQLFVDSNKNPPSLDEVDRKLTAAGISHARQSSMLNSAEMPMELYDLIESKKTVGVFFSRTGSNGVFLQVNGDELRPFEGEPAATLARQLLRADAIKAEQGMVNYSANIETRYEDEFAQIMNAAAQNAK